MTGAVLSVPDAWDVAAYVQSQPRLHKADLDRDFTKRLRQPADSGYGPYLDGFSQEQHRLGPSPPSGASAQRPTTIAKSQLPSAPILLAVRRQTSPETTA